MTDDQIAHAKGEILSGTFTPSEEAKKLSTAPHFANPTTPIWARFSVSQRSTFGSSNYPVSLFGYSQIVRNLLADDVELNGYPKHPRCRPKCQP